MPITTEIIVVVIMTSMFATTTAMTIIRTQRSLSECRINWSVRIFQMTAMTVMFKRVYKITGNSTRMHMDRTYRMMQVATTMTMTTATAMRVTTAATVTRESLFTSYCERIVIQNRRVNQKTLKLFDVRLIERSRTFEGEIQSNIISYSYFHIIIC